MHAPLLTPEPKADNPASSPVERTELSIFSVSREKSAGLFQEIEEFLYGKAGVFENALQRPAVNFAVIGNNQGDLSGGMEKFDVAAALANLDVTGAQESVDDFIAGEKRRLHIARFKTVL